MPWSLGLVGWGWLGVVRGRAWRESPWFHVPLSLGLVGWGWLGVVRGRGLEV